MPSISASDLIALTAKLNKRVAARGWARAAIPGDIAVERSKPGKSSDIVGSREKTQDDPWSLVRRRSKTTWPFATRVNGVIPLRQDLATLDPD
jgi:hypothetical protein